jgi:hypothetical protein
VLAADTSFTEAASAKLMLIAVKAVAIIILLNFILCLILKYIQYYNAILKIWFELRGQKIKNRKRKDVGRRSKTL